MNTFYLTERKQRRKRLIFKLKICGGFSLAVLILTAAVYLTFDSKLFRVKNIVIQEINPPSGNYNIDKADLEANLLQDLKNFYAGRSRLNRFLGPDNIFVWDGKVVPDTKLFLDKYVIISGLRVKGDLFKKNVEINYQKRDRFGAWCPKGAATDNLATAAGTNAVQSKCFWFDSNGVIFSAAPDIEGNLLYRVDDYSGRDLGAGSPVLEAGLLPNLFRIFSFLQKTDLATSRLELDNIAFEEIKTAPLVSSTPIIYFSLRFDPAFALAALNSEEKNNLEKARYIDLRVENRVYYK